MKLPRNKALRKHPLLALLTYAEQNGTSIRQVAIKEFGMTQQSLFDLIAKARKDRDYLVPAERVPTVCKLTGIAPYYFNPKLWPSPDWLF